ncbi:putative peroxiredoxin/MT2597 [Thalassoglobus neptunius]|uniref:Putative peroxiredoxin/MT2597 n=1 Tax=Thalassoglobus neptunius TaxID=1938619 RepID=A0A5C5VRE6_9PLAN|nr:peroxiredoxin family protein [Thalassoglobus neptunius]TWT40737.1 putative peroxiredoxin/MT2597 [Thalassoglobus neptunius]
MRLRLLLMLTLLVCSQRLFGQEADSTAADESDGTEVLEGHSFHGEVFDEGPRQAAVLIPGTGNVDFPATCKSVEVQEFINQGVGQLHGFWYLESERSFRQAAAIDPDCAIAYWGMAMSNRDNRKRALGFITEAVERKENASDREKMYIDALAKFFEYDPKKSDEDKDSDEKDAKEVDKEKRKEEEKKRRQTLVKDYEEILHRYPDDIEARAFLGLALYENRTKGIPISSYYAVDALLKSVLEVNPLHPCHHFVIHLWDYEEPKLALDSASKCGASAPAIAHMWHMPGHTYSRLHRYHDAVWQQEASARTDHAHMMRTQLLPDQIHNFAHNNEWLIRNLIFVGRSTDAVALAMNMIDLPRHPKYNTLKKSGSAKYGRTRLMQTLQSFHLWNQVLELQDSIYLEPTEIEEEQQKRDVLIGMAKFQTGDVLGGCEILTRFKQQLASVEKEQAEAGEKAREKAQQDEKSDKDQTKAADAAKRKFASQIRSLNTSIHTLTGCLHLSCDAFEDAHKELSKVSGFDKGWLAWIELQAGRTEKAIEAINKHVSSSQSQTIPLAWQVRILWEAGKQEEAKEAFEKLKAISSEIDIEGPIYSPLASIAKEFGDDQDWRVEREIPEDFGQRPELTSLGPFRWMPTNAKEFQLPDHKESLISLSDYQGKPVVVIFYLGYGCLHCAEQLQAFAPMTEKFSEAGISLLAISSDSVENLLLSHENYGDEKFPFQLVSDENLDVFKAYRCYDDFEQQTLHGTFLIDEQGRIRWHDISYEPFMDAEFVLEESKRLLKNSPASKKSDETPAVTQNAE